MPVDLAEWDGPAYPPRELCDEMVVDVPVSVLATLVAVARAAREVIASDEPLAEFGELQHRIAMRTLDTALRAVADTAADRGQS